MHTGELVHQPGVHGAKSQFAALALRPNGDVSFTSDPNEMDTANLTK